MRLAYDPEADALYLQLGAAKVEETQEVAPNVMLDLDCDGNVLGIEVLGVSLRPGAEPWRIDTALNVREGASLKEALIELRRSAPKAPELKEPQAAE